MKEIFDSDNYRIIKISIDEQPVFEVTNDQYSPNIISKEYYVDIDGTFQFLFFSVLMYFFYICSVKICGYFVPFLFR